MSTPIRRAYAGSIACSASMNAQMPPRRCASAITWYTSVVFPDDSGPKISTTRPRGSPPMPSARSSASEPVETAPTATWGRSLMRMTDPLPNCRSICPSATSSASSRFMRSSSRLYSDVSVYS